MSALGSLRNLANKVLAPAGLELNRYTIGGERGRSTMSGAVRRVADLGFDLRTVLDVGAATGRWTLMARERLPGANFLMVEALRERADVLGRVCQTDPQRLHYDLCAAGSESGTTRFMVSPDLDGSGVAAGKTHRGEELREVPMKTLDQLVREKNLPGPYGVKLDTHGFEVPILEGAKDVLSQTRVLIVECYLFRSSVGRLMFWEMCNWLGERGFRCFDMVDPLLRPRDGMLWQMDLFFARSDWPKFQETHYAS